MKSPLAKLSLAATFGLALAFTFSCSSNGVTDDDGWFGHGQGSSSSSRGGGVSSPGGKSSSSFVNGSSLVNCYFYYEDEMYCIDKSEDYAFTYDECLYIDGTVVSSCKNVGGSSSPSGKSSSSSRGGGSISSSSNTNRSSSSIVRSSSSAVVYSSSSIPRSSSSSATTVSGSCNIKDYKTVKIGDQTWMAENYNCNVAGSVCYDNDPANCNKYGRFYNWEAAMDVCPRGWHLPDSAEWRELVDFAGGEGVAGLHLKAKEGWNDYKGESGNGKDTYGFAALPGNYVSNGSFSIVGEYGVWWSSSAYGSDGFLFPTMVHEADYVTSLSGSYSNINSFNVRCIKD